MRREGGHPQGHPQEKGDTGMGVPRPHSMVGGSITGREDPKNPICGGWERHGVDATEMPSHGAW